MLSPLAVQRELPGNSSTMKCQISMHGRLSMHGRYTIGYLAVILCRYERQIRELKAELTMRDTLAGRGQVNYSDLSDAEVADLKALVSDFLEGNTSMDLLPVQTLKQVKETYRQMQLAYKACKASQVTDLQLHPHFMFHTMATHLRAAQHEAAIEPVKRQRMFGRSVNLFHLAVCKRPA